LLRATGRDRNAGDAAQLARGWPKPAALRGDAAAKRALWPQLRRLRRQPP
jgi:DNA polymerase III psi subunit